MSYSPYYTKNNVNTIVLNEKTYNDMYNEFIDMISFIINIIIMFLSITKMIKVIVLSFTVCFVLHKLNLLEMFWNEIIYKYEYIDLALTLITLSISVSIIIMFKIISDKINKRFEELYDEIKEKNDIIIYLTKKIATKTD